MGQYVGSEWGVRRSLEDKRKDFGTRGCTASYLYANPGEATSASAVCSMAFGYYRFIPPVPCCIHIRIKIKGHTSRHGTSGGTSFHKEKV